MCFVLTSRANKIGKNRTKKSIKHNKNTPKMGCFCYWRREEDTAQYNILWYCCTIKHNILCVFLRANNSKTFYLKIYNPPRFSAQGIYPI